MTSSVVLNVEFSSAHLYKQKKWSPEKNLQTFGACYTEFGHGHNYKWEVTLDIPASADLLENKSFESWLLVQQSSLNRIAKVLDHQHLNFVIPEFSEKIPTTENISLYLKEKLLQTDLAQWVLSFRLFEMENLWTHVQIRKTNELL